MNDLLKIGNSLWLAIHKIRGDIDQTNYKHIVLGLIFLRYITENLSNDQRDNLTNPFHVPHEAQWNRLIRATKSLEIEHEIEHEIDQVITSIEENNVTLKDILRTSFVKTTLNVQQWAELVQLIDSIPLSIGTLNDNVLRYTFEHLLERFAEVETSNNVQFYTPKSIREVLVNMLAPEQAKSIYDGCCGSGSLLLEAFCFMNKQASNKHGNSFFGQEKNIRTLRLGQMNLIIHGLKTPIEFGDTFTQDKFLNMNADYIISTPPLNQADYLINKEETQPWKFGIPPAHNANYAWLQHFAGKLSPKGRAGIVLASSSLNSEISAEVNIRRNMLKANLVECIVSLPSQLLHHTHTSVCIWFLNRKKQGDRLNEILFIDARELGTKISRKQKNISDTHIALITEIYQNWRYGGNGKTTFADVPSLCKSVILDDVRKNNYILTPTRYINFAEQTSNKLTFEEEMKQLTATLAEQMERAAIIDEALKKSLSKLGYKL